MKFVKVSKILTDEEEKEQFGQTYVNAFKKQLEMLKENTDIILSRFMKLGKDDFEPLSHIQEITMAFSKVNDRLESLNEDLGLTRKIQ